jgi:hypothetical protein
VAIAFATEDAITDHGTKRIMDRHALVEVISMVDQNVLHMLRLIEQNAREGSKMHAADIVFACHALQEAQTIMCKFGQVSHLELIRKPVEKESGHSVESR